MIVTLALLAQMLLLPAPPAGAELDKSLKTKFATIYYNEDREIVDFSWRMARMRLPFEDSALLTTNRVDAIIERVQRLLQMYPEHFHVEILLKRDHRNGPIAFYSYMNRNITVFLDQVTDGVLAHELAHAVINAYYEEPPPEEAQEVLAQYVDRQLWA